ncbi:hypothetical protein [Sorangium sp. So ce1078]|uniref:hypothetical protein n=1 Tax=Sorangium sp. So ce1078 TaxID=3133329 RepID=UPI003F62AAF0
MGLRSMTLLVPAVLCAACASEPATDAAAASAQGALRGDLAAQASEAFGRSGAIREIERGEGWARVQIEVHDEAYPLVVDVVASTHVAPSRVLYMLPGGGLNFTGNFFTPRDRNITHFMRDHGYLVVGISPREDGIDPASSDASLEHWGLAKRKQDIRNVIATVDRWLGLPHDILGHSAGGGHALDYAATYAGRLGKVMVLDTTGPYDPAAAPAYAANAQRSLAAYEQLLAAGRFTIDAAGGLEGLIAAAVTDPLGDSGVPRAIAGSFAGDFTRSGLVHYALIHTNQLPGPTTPLTGLPQNWFYEQGHLAGQYTFAADPQRDGFHLTHAPLAVFEDALAELGSGVVTTATMRDLLAVWSGASAYVIDWGNIKAKVVWVNTELGRGDHPLGAQLIEGAGHADVRFSVVPGYGHADPVYGRSAEVDVWPLLLE